MEKLLDTKIRDKSYLRSVGMIMDMIAEGKLQYGDQLYKEQELAEMLGVSRPTMREALRVLEFLGIASAVPHKGISISRPSETGGYLPLLGAGHRVGEGDTIVLESCEYCDSFLNFAPTLAVILNVEADHLDYFKDLADVEKSFRKFAELSSHGVIANGDDPHVVETLEGMDYITFGLCAQNTVHPENISIDWRHMDVICDGTFYCHLDLKVIGKHNALNALGAVAAAWKLGIPGEAVAEGLKTFGGANRRMQYKGSINGADVYDDYAHHPDELKATIEAVRTMKYDRVVVAFQPHTYTRTHALFGDFVRELAKADHLVLAEIYAARERNTVGISSKDLQERIPGSVYCKDLPQVTDYLRSIAKDGDIILTVGAGDIFRAGEALLK